MAQSQAAASSAIRSHAYEGDLLADLEQFRLGDHLRDDDTAEAEQQINGMTFDEVMAAYDLAVFIASESEGS